MVFDETIIDIDESNYDNFLHSKLSIIHFFSDRHMGCLMTMPLIEDIAREFRKIHEEILFGKVDIDEFGSIARKHKISSVPSIIMLRSGEQVDKLDVIQEEVLREKINSLFKSSHIQII